MSLSVFLHQAYWWLSLIGGFHCIILAVFLSVPRSHQQNGQFFISSIFITLALYFFTGIVNRDNAPLPMHLILMLLTPLYFLLMPLVYQYIKHELNILVKSKIKELAKHFFPTLLIALLVMSFALTHYNSIDFKQSETLLEGMVNNASVLGVLLPLLLMLQTGFYFTSIIKLLYVRLDSHSSPFHLARFRWLLFITIAIIINWLIRCMVAILPFILGDQYELLSETVTRLSLLLTLYILTIYRLQQLTVLVYQSNKKSDVRSKKSLLDNDEKAFIKQVIQEQSIEQGFVDSKGTEIKKP
ncbi:MAG: hypothetical protein ACPGUD_07185 [Parashewanella sp.]